MTSNAIYCFDRASVLFAIQPEGRAGPRILAEISEDALRDIFSARGGGNSLVAACNNHFELIEVAALQRYRREPVKPVMLEISDFAFPAAFAIDSCIRTDSPAMAQRCSASG